MQCYDLLALTHDFFSPAREKKLERMLVHGTQREQTLLGLRIRDTKTSRDFKPSLLSQILGCF